MYGEKATMEKRGIMKKRLLTSLTSIMLSIMVVFTMIPSVSFAYDEDVPEDTSGTEVYTDTPSAEVDGEIPESDGEAKEADTEVTAEDTAEDTDAVFEAKGESESAESISANPNTTGALYNTSNYSSKLRIYGIYLHRADGSRVSSDRYGDAVLIESNGKFLLMDTGAIEPIKNSDAVYHSSLVSTLKSIGVRELDVYISHLHSDHTGGLKDVCENFKVNRLYLPDLELCKNYETPTGLSIESRYAKNINIALGKDEENSKASVKEIVFLKPSFRGHKPIVNEEKEETEGETVTNIVNYCHDARITDRFSVGAVTFSVIGPVGTYTIEQFRSQDGDCGSKEGHCLNNCSLVTLVQCGSFRFLSAGDIEKQEENALIGRYGYGLDCNMLKASHHGLKTSSSTSFLDRVTPMWSFNEDHGYTGSTTAQVREMKNRGYNFSVQDNRCNFIADITNSRTRIYADNNNNGRVDERPLTGWVKVTGKKARYQYYNPAGYIQTEWMWLDGALYYLDDNSGFRHIGKSVIRGVNVEFDANGKLISHKGPKKTTLKSAKIKRTKKAIKIKTKNKKKKKKKYTYSYKVKVTWKKAKRASTYQVFRKAGKNGAFVLVGEYKASKKSATFKKGFQRGTTYYYKVRAVRYVAGGPMYGAFSKVKKVKAK